MAHSELIEKTYRDLKVHKMSKKAVDEMINDIFGYIEDRLIEHQDFRISSFGRWYTVDVKAKKGTHPATQKQITIPACKRIRFKPSKSLLQRIK